MLIFLPAETAELEVKHGDLEVDKRLSLYGLIFSDVVPPERFIDAEKAWKAVRKKRIALLGERLSSLLKPLFWAGESGFEILV